MGENFTGREVRIYLGTPERRLEDDEARDYLATGEVPEKAFTSWFGPQRLEKYAAADEATRRHWRSNLGPVTVAIGEMTGTGWHQQFASGVEVYMPNALHPMKVSVGGSSRPLADAVDHLDCYRIAVNLASDAQSIRVQNGTACQLCGAGVNRDGSCSMSCSGVGDG